MNKFLCVFLIVPCLICADKPSIPNEIARDIIARATEQYPHDYSVRAYIIEKEVKAYMRIKILEEAVSK